MIVRSSNKGHSEDLLVRSFDDEELRERVGVIDGERGMMAAGNSLLSSLVLIAHDEARIDA